MLKRTFVVAAVLVAAGAIILAIMQFAYTGATLETSGTIDAKHYCVKVTRHARHFRIVNCSRTNVLLVLEFENHHHRSLGPYGPHVQQRVIDNYPGQAVVIHVIAGRSTSTDMSIAFPATP